ncbi:sensor histidine kinase [Amycolatopsis thermophila]|uniref:histidine kinase n=1 Tax=Amycolatopsis thermophila TaxID=206084 RepID=A0ABU0F3X3_9PSEU|nr:histidine kinase [Amycolatopsis thermophila]MDQ0382044.1 signal transduction histidine kinase [Amycolatopsis thermophila]
MHGDLFCERGRTALTCAAAGGFVATAVGEILSGLRGLPLAGELALGVLGCALVPLLFRRPVPSAFALMVLTAFGATATPPASIGVVQIARRGPLGVAVGVATAGVAGHLVRGLWRPTPGLPFEWWVVLVVLGHAALVGGGALAEARRALIVSLTERARRAEAEQGRRVAEARAAERTRIAREMHDVLAHRLSLLATYAGALEYRPDSAPERIAQAAGVIRATVHQALEELRHVIALLRDSDEDLEGPLPTLAGLPDLVEESRAVGTPVEVRDGLADPAAVPGATGRAAYRVLQEALTNARKHAPGRPVRIELGGAPGTRLRIEVSNPVTDGVRGPGTGTGLVGLTERVRLAGGRLDHEAAAGEFRLSAELPWPA